MLDILFLFGAIALLVALQMLRGVLAFVFPTAQSRSVTLTKVPDAIADLHAQAQVELAALGFTGPRWRVLRIADGVDDETQFYAVHVNADGDVCRLFPVAATDKPNRLNVVFATRLADGRTAIGQALDPFFELVAPERFPSRTLGGATIAEHWQAHRDFVTSLGVARDPAGASEAAIAAFDDEVFNESQRQLLDSGKAWRDSRGLARPTLAFAWRMLRALVQRPKPPPDTVPVPPARLAMLAQKNQRVAERPAPRRMQAGLFVVSVVLFLALGAVFWSVPMALTLLVVIAIHELGHYLAMRAFGYRNVQMLALPLVGGVTIGHEAKPDAARRAWMSLMGPLPGVVIGWAMLLALPHFDAPSWWMTAAWVFLGLNYLNVLPVPPLDGGHVVQALLPVRAAKLQAVFIVVACVVGAIGAYWLGFTLLAVLALLQLTLAGGHWQLARLIAHARGDAALDPSRPRVLRLRRLFEIADDLVGPTPKAAPRIAQATAVLASLDVKPMHWLQRTVIGTVYAALLAGPVFVAVVMFDMSRWMPSEAEVAARVEQLEREKTELEARASAADLGMLLHDAVDLDDAPPPPASDEALTAAQTRLGVTLPDELAALYRTHDGFPAFHILPVASLARWRDAAPQVYAEATSGDMLDVFVVSAADGDTQTHRVPKERAGEWLLLTSTEDGPFYAYDAGEPTAVPGQRLFAISGSYTQAHETLRAWLEYGWISRVQHRAMRERHDVAVAARERELADLPLAELLERLPKPGLLERLIGSGPTTPESADAAVIAAAQTRLGVVLDDDLRALASAQDGVSELRLAGVAAFHRVDLADAAAREALSFYTALPYGAKPPVNWPTSVDELGRCIVIGGVGYEPHATVLWCPDFEASRRYLDLQSRRVHATLTDLVRGRVARMLAFDVD